MVSTSPFSSAKAARPVLRAPPLSARHSGASPRVHARPPFCTARRPPVPPAAVPARGRRWMRGHFWSFPNSASWGHCSSPSSPVHEDVDGLPRSGTGLAQGSVRPAGCALARWRPPAPGRSPRGGPRERTKAGDCAPCLLTTAVDQPPGPAPGNHVPSAGDVTGLVTFHWATPSALWGPGGLSPASRGSARWLMVSLETRLPTWASRWGPRPAFG